MFFTEITSLKFPSLHSIHFFQLSLTLQLKINLIKMIFFSFISSSAARANGEECTTTFASEILNEEIQIRFSIFFLFAFHSHQFIVKNLFNFSIPSLYICLPLTHQKKPSWNRSTIAAMRGNYSYSSTESLTTRDTFSWRI